MTRRKKDKPKIAGVRVVNGKRVNLSALREKRAANRKGRAENAAPIEDTRVSDVWRRDELRQEAKPKLTAEARRMRRLQEADGGKDGTVVSDVSIRVSGHRQRGSKMRARPGTFEWRYGRNRQDVLFHAGSHLAILWEKAGMTVGSSADILRGTRSGYATGISAGRLAAIDKLDGFVSGIGTAPASRLIDYCVAGLTTAEIARKNDHSEREMASALHLDLKECARHFKFVGGNRG